MTQITVINGATRETALLDLLTIKCANFDPYFARNHGDQMVMRNSVSPNTFHLFMNALRNDSLEGLTTDNLREIKELAEELGHKEFLAACEKFSASVNDRPQRLDSYIDQRVEEALDERLVLTDHLESMYQDIADDFKELKESLETEVALLDKRYSRKLNEIEQQKEALANELSEKILGELKPWIQEMISKGNKAMLGKISETSDSIRAQISQFQTDFGQRLSQVEMKQEQHAQSIHDHTIDCERLSDEIRAIGRKNSEQHANNDRRLVELEKRLRDCEQRAKEHIDPATISQILDKQGRFERKLNAIVQQMGDVRRSTADFVFAGTPDYEQKIDDLTDAVRHVTTRLSQLESDVEKQANVPPPEVDRAQLKALEERLTAQLRSLETSTSQSLGLTNAKFSELDLKVDKQHKAIALIKTMLTHSAK